MVVLGGVYTTHRPKGDREIVNTSYNRSRSIHIPNIVVHPP